MSALLPAYKGKIQKRSIKSCESCPKTKKVIHGPFQGLARPGGVAEDARHETGCITPVCCGRSRKQKEGMKSAFCNFKMNASAQP